jgi:hypothetical protein
MKLNERVKRKYDRPEMQVVSMKQSTHLLQSSATVPDYDIENEQNWP